MSSPRFAPLFLAGSSGGVSAGEEEEAAASPELAEGVVLISPTSTLQAAAAVSPVSPPGTCCDRSTAAAVPFSRDRSRSHRRTPREARPPVGLALAGALNGEGPVAAATTMALLTGQRRPSPREVAEASESEGYTRVVARGPNQRTTHIFDGGRVVADEHMSCGFSLVPREGRSGEEVDGFLRWCHGCSKDLGEGKDIFMYRGEMAFCSHECRYREMLLHENL